MTNLTDPRLAPLVARYRAWVEEQNRKAGDYRRRENNAIDEEYEAASRSYADLPWWKRLVTPKPVQRAHVFLFDIGWKTVSWQGFLDWCIREGIEVPEDAT